MEALRGCVLVTLYSVATLVNWSEIQNGLVVEKDSPQAPCKLGSTVVVPMPDMFETRFVWT
jgi:hypothetical protein